MRIRQASIRRSKPRNGANMHPWAYQHELAKSASRLVSHLETLQLEHVRQGLEQVLRRAAFLTTPLAVPLLCGLHSILFRQPHFCRTLQWGPKQGQRSVWLPESELSTF